MFNNLKSEYNDYKNNSIQKTNNSENKIKELLDDNTDLTKLANDIKHEQHSLVVN